METLKIPVREVEILWHEGDGLLSGRKFDSMTQAFNAIQAHTKPPELGYDKHGIKVTWNDGASFEMRFDYGDRVNGKGSRLESVVEHARGHFEFYSGRVTPSHMTKERHEELLQKFGVNKAEYSEFLDTRVFA